MWYYKDQKFVAMQYHKGRNFFWCNEVEVFACFFKKWDVSHQKKIVWYIIKIKMLFWFDHR